MAVDLFKAGYDDGDITDLIIEATGEMTTMQKVVKVIARQSYRARDYSGPWTEEQKQTLIEIMKLPREFHRDFRGKLRMTPQDLANALQDQYDKFFTPTMVNRQFRELTNKGRL